MFDISKHPYFEEYIDEKSGVKSYILKEKVARLQLNYYFCDIGLTHDNKYLWFKCIDWPAQNHHLGVMSMDPENPFIRKFPHASMNMGQPNLIPGTHDAIISIDNEVYRVNIEGNVSKILEVDKEIIRNRKMENLSTHLSVNCDNELVVLDMRIGGRTYVATGNIKTGEVKMLHKFKRRYAHAMFSPDDPKLFLMDQDWEFDMISGEHFDMDQRVWLMNTEATRLEPILPGYWYMHGDSIICHDFWSKDGWICWPDYLGDVCEYNIHTKELNHVWKHRICHAHTNDRQLWVGDDSPYEWKEKPCRVVFFDRESGREIDIFSAMPRPNFRSSEVYHLDPHPSFSRDGKHIISMTTVKNGEVDISITPVEPLLKLCREKGLKVND